MNPEFDRLAGRVMNSPYFYPDFPRDLPDAEVMAMLDRLSAERAVLERAWSQGCASYEVLQGRAKAIFDRAVASLGDA